MIINGLEYFGQITNICFCKMFHFERRGICWSLLKYSKFSRFFDNYFLFRISLIAFSGTLHDGDEAIKQMFWVSSANCGNSPNKGHAK